MNIESRAREETDGLEEEFIEQQKEEKKIFSSLEHFVFILDQNDL